MKQGGPHSLPLDQWDFQGQMGFSGQMPARKQALGWGRKTWEPATAASYYWAEDMYLPQGVMELGSGSKEQGKGGASLG